MKTKKTGFILMLAMVILPLILGCGIFDRMMYGAPVRPEDYTPLNPGDCFVPPQGDPVYDQFYAQQVNPDNCESFVDQGQGKLLESQATAVVAQAENMQAQTQKITLKNWINGLGAGTVFLIALFAIGIGIFAVTR